MNKKFFILALALSFCSLTAYAASNLETATYGKDKIASSSNATGEKLGFQNRYQMFKYVSFFR